MMSDEQAKAVGLRAVACPGWRWLKGTPLGPDCRHMVIEDSRTEEGLALVNTYKEHTWWMEPDQVAGRGAYAEDGPAWPDFRSPAALGGLEALVREAWGDDTLVAISVNANAWELHCRAATNTQSQLPGWTYPTFEAEALVEALEACPARVQP